MNYKYSRWYKCNRMKTRKQRADTTSDENACSLATKHDHLQKLPTHTTSPSRLTAGHKCGVHLILQNRPVVDRQKS
jgi:hypothetical protein